MIKSICLRAIIDSIDNAGKLKAEFPYCPVVWAPGPTEKHREIMRRIMAEVEPKDILVPDAHLAALAMEHGLILCFADRNHDVPCS